MGNGTGTWRNKLLRLMTRGWTTFTSYCNATPPRHESFSVIEDESHRSEDGTLKDFRYGSAGMSHMNAQDRGSVKRRCSGNLTPHITRHLHHGL